MISMRTILEVADNSGARKLQCIAPRGGSLGRQAGLGDIVTASVRECTPESNPELFRATIGGLGLTGLITWAEIGLRPLGSTTIEAMPSCLSRLLRTFQ